MKENIYLELWCSSPQKKKLWCSLNNKLFIIFLYSFSLVPKINYVKDMF